MVWTQDYIKGYLQGIAQLNMGAHCSLDYDLDEIPATGTLVESVCAYMQLAPTQVSLDRLSAWEQTLLELLPHWFFYRRYDEQARAVDSSMLHDDQEQASRQFIHILKEWLSREGSTTTAFRVDSQPASFYELEWDDFLFFTNGKLYFLHFGRSD
ncbi:hypothetical protein [Paenibacillus campi]|uniref:hypothetical protein n=1 Tax=Paenibacillus campi TaxID=3106031 RepID=UPI002AFF2E22|nr:hypothetical protein [Paenibacillus sp. SGZ-1014]